MLINQKKLFLFTAIIVAAATAFVACTNSSAESKKSDNAISQDSLVKRGNYLVTIAGCDDCHTPKKMGPMGPEPDMSLRLSGYRSSVPFPKVDTNVIRQGWALVNPELTGWAGPWGASFTANITSDETGIGNWSYDQFKKAFTQGKWKGLEGTRPLMPPMPWQNYSHMVEDDVKAIFAYLKSTRPIKNVEPPIKPFNSLP
jgi:hypothetical protein